MVWGGGGKQRDGKGKYFIVSRIPVVRSCRLCLGEFFVNMLKMDDRSAEIDPSSNVSDGESDTTGRYLGYFKLHATSWPAICMNTEAIHTRGIPWPATAARSWITRLLWLLSQKEYTQCLCELHTPQMSVFFTQCAVHALWHCYIDHAGAIFRKTETGCVVCLARISKLEDPYVNKSVKALLVKIDVDSVNKELLNADVMSVLVNFTVKRYRPKCQDL